jgi:hypothetical protein
MIQSNLLFVNSPLVVGASKRPRIPRRLQL